MIAMANAPGSNAPMLSNVGATGSGRPEGTGAIERDPVLIERREHDERDAAGDGYERPGNARRDTRGHEENDNRHE